MPATRDATIDDALVLEFDAGAPMPWSWLEACGA
jgi:hypothetical protein